jgi:hypothetical protein
MRAGELFERHGESGAATKSETTFEPPSNALDKLSRSQEQKDCTANTRFHR